MVSKKNKKFKILCLDAGGVRGILENTILLRLCEKFPSLIEDINMITGISVGNLISLSLAYDLTPQKIQEILKFNGKTIFSSKTLNPFKPRFSNKAFIRLVNNTFPEDLLLSDLNKIIATATVQVSGSIDSIKPIIYTNTPLSTNKHTSVRDLAICGGTVPAYFPMNLNQVDGVLVASNPSLVAIAIAVNQLNIPLKRISILSIGSGFFPRVLPEDAYNWGPSQWILNKDLTPPIFDVYTMGQSALENTLSSMFIKSRYHRLDIPLEKDVPFNDYKSMKYLINKANKYDLSKTYSWLKMMWYS